MSERLLKALATLAALNFAAFIVMDIILGGDALSGKIEDGRYYLGNHGSFKEVGHAVFIYSACHAYSGLLGLGVAGLIVQHLRRRAR